MWQALIGPALDALSKQTGQQEQQNASMRQQLVGMSGQQSTPLQQYASQNQSQLSPEAMGAIAGLFAKKKPVAAGEIQPTGQMSVPSENQSSMYDPQAWTNYLGK